MTKNFLFVILFWGLEAHQWPALDKAVHLQARIFQQKSIDITIKRAEAFFSSGVDPLQLKPAVDPEIQKVFWQAMADRKTALARAWHFPTS